MRGFAQALAAAAFLLFSPLAAAAPLSAEDDVAIRQFYADYAQSLDFGRQDKVREFFAPNATIDGKSASDALTAGAADIPGARHYVTNILITPSNPGAKVVAYGLAVASPPGQGGRLNGQTTIYSDELTKTARGWRFKAREISKSMPKVATALERGAAARAPRELTASDYAEIHNLYAAYAFADDAGDAAKLASYFTPDGSFASSAGNHALQPLATAKRAAIEAGRASLVANVLLTSTAAGAKAEAYVIAVSPGPGGELKATLATYADTLVRTTKGWRFKTREVWDSREPEPPADFTGIDLAKAQAAMGATTALATRTAAATGAMRALSARDYFEINQLYALYGFGVDSGDGLRRASAFAADGTIASNLTEHRPGTMADMIARTERIGRKARPIGGHTFFNVVLTPTATGASGVAYAILTNKGPAGENALRGTPAVYTDTFIRTKDGWRIKDRDIWLDSEDISPYRPGKCSPAPCRN